MRRSALLRHTRGSALGGHERGATLSHVYHDDSLSPEPLRAMTNGAVTAEKVI
jgi:hypothetical protein